MGLLDRFRAGGLRPAWDYSVAGILWRVIPAPPETVVGEERDTVAKRTTFFALDLKSGRVRWSGRRFLDDWWVGVSAVHRDVLLLHGYAKPDMPGHLGIVAADIPSGNILWSEPACALVELRDEKVVLCRPSITGQDREERLLRTGMPAGSDSAADLAAAGGASEGAGEILVPYLMDPAGGLDARLERLFRSSLQGKDSTLPLEVIEHPRAVIVLSHEPASPSSGPTLLRGCLRVLEPNAGALLYEEVVQTEVHVPVRNTFCVVRDMLLYTKEGRSLRAIPL